MPPNTLKWNKTGFKMSTLSDFAEGFLAMTVVIWIFNILSVVGLHSYAWIVWVYALVLLITIPLIVYAHLQGKSDVNRFRRILISMIGVPIACWVFDVTITYYIIDVRGWAVEVNPLGWPLGILGALLFYIPELAFMYLLLFKIKHKISNFAAIFLTFLALFMGFMNLAAGLQNFGVSSAYLPVLLEITFALIIILTKSKLASLIKKRFTEHSNGRLPIKVATNV